MIDIFSAKKIKCFFCKEVHEEKETHELEYATKNGTHSVRVCPRCTQHLNKIIDIKESLNE